MSTSLPHVLLGAAMLPMLAWLPGIALCRLLAPGLSRLTVVAAAPATTAGILYCSGQLATALGLAVDGRLPAGAVTAAIGSLLWSERRTWRGWAPRALPLSVLGAWLLGAGVWIAGIRHLLAVPPHNDGYNHGYFVARIARYATLDPGTVIPHDVVTGGKGAAFYPLALHQQAAVLVRVAHLDVGIAWTLTSLSIVVLALPLGMYVLGRQLFPGNRRAIAACAWVAALTPGISYATSWWGGFPLAAGLALCPGMLYLLHVVGDRPRAGTVLLAGVGLAGVAGVHTSEFTLLAALCGLTLMAPLLAQRAWGHALAASLSLAVAFGVALMLLSPALAQLHGGLQERTFAPATEGLPFIKTVLEVLIQFSFVPPATPPAIVVATWAGIIVAVRRRSALPWLAAWTTFGVLYVWLAAFPSDLVTTLTSSWYSDRFRLGMILAFLAIPFAALALAGPGNEVPGPRTRGWRAGAVALAGVLGVTVVHDSVSAIHENYSNYSLVGRDERAAFAYLADHARPGEHVLNQHQDDSPWMYSLYGVAPVFAVKTNNYESNDWDDALYLSRHVAAAGEDARVDALLKQFDVRYVYVGDKVFPTEKADIRSKDLEGSTAFRLVFDRGRAKVFERIAP